MVTYDLDWLARTVVKFDRTERAKVLHCRTEFHFSVDPPRNKCLGTMIDIADKGLPSNKADASEISKMFDIEQKEAIGHLRRDATSTEGKDIV